MDKESNKKKNILIFFWYYLPPGGAELFVEEITKRLSQKYNFEIIAARGTTDLPKEEQMGTALIHRVGIGSFFFDKFLFPFYSIKKAYEIKKEKEISLIHGVIANPAGLAAMLFHSLTKIPFLLTEQSGNLEQKVKNLGPITFAIYKSIYQAADFIHAITGFLKKTISALGVNEEKIKVIPNGVNLSEFGQRVERKEHRIICVARLEKYKGIDYLIDAMPEILKSFPRTKLILIGDGSEQKSLATKAKALTIEDRIEFRGDIVHKQIPEELAQSHVFVLPSLEEGQGLVVLEAQATGIPVIATNVGGIPDFIKNGETGILIKPKDQRAIAQNVIKVFSDSNFSKRLAENAQRYLEKYEWNNIAQKIDQIYQKLIL